MTATTVDRDTPRHGGQEFGGPVKGNTKLLVGTIIAFDATGFLVHGITSTTLKAAGIAQSTVDNTGGADGAVQASFRRGVYRLANSAGGDQLTNADYGNDCYIVDNQTVAKTTGGATRSVAGKCRGIDAPSGGVWVEF